jgi:thiol-disulfide isomerase/thioredoxin
MNHRHLLGTLPPSLATAAAIAASVLCAPFAAGQDRIGEPVSAEMHERLQQLSREALNQTPSYQRSPMAAIEDEQTPAGSPLVLYIGADYCPYCAAMRWPLALALLRFGELTGLEYMRSSSRDVFPDTPTFSFEATEFDSDDLRFEPVEIQDRAGKALQRPTELQRDKFLQFDGRGSIPFLYLGGRYLEVGSPFSPAPLQGLDWEQVAQRLEQGSDAVWQSVIGETNLMTAAICTLTNGRPEDVCLAPGVEAAARHLP